MIEPENNKSGKYPIRFFLLRLLALFIIVAILDFCTGVILRYYYFRQESGLQFRSTYAIEKTTADILIFGSSRANHHYHPDVFSRRSGMSYYNAGRDGNFMFYHYAVLQAVLKRYTPKKIFLDFNAREFAVSPDNYDRISSLLPYYSSHPEMRSIIELKSPYEKIKLLSSVYPFNSLALTVAAGNMEFNKIRKADNKGYISLAATWKGNVYIDTGAVKYDIDSTVVGLYELFIKDCKKAGINLYIVSSPYFMKSNHTDYSVIIGKQIAAKYEIPFFDHSLDSAFNSKPELFSDIKHLNDQGARIFSEMLIDEILLSETIKKL